MGVVKKIIAYHEAGHAVAARVLGIAVAYVSTLEGGEAALTGCATYLARNANQAAQLAAIRKDIIVCLAGPYAQGKHRVPKKKNPDEWADDLAHAQNLVGQAAVIASGVDVHTLDPNKAFTLDDHQAEYAQDLWRQCSDQSRHLVNEHWPTIAKVAEVLLMRPVLDVRDLDELIGAVEASSNAQCK